jgi:hypothetical protein
MFVGDLNSKEELQDIIVCELRKFGVKYRRTDKKQKIVSSFPTPPMFQDTPRTLFDN